MRTSSSDSVTTTFAQAPAIGRTSVARAASRCSTLAATVRVLATVRAIVATGQAIVPPTAVIEAVATGRPIEPVRAIAPLL